MPPLDSAINIFTQPLAATASPIARVKLPNATAGAIAYDGKGLLAVCLMRRPPGAVLPIEQVLLYKTPLSASSLPVTTFTLPLPGCGALAFDHAGKLFVASQTNRVWIFAPPFSAGSTPTQTIMNGVVTAFGVAFDAKGNLYVFDNGSAATAARILVYAPPFTSPAYVITKDLQQNSSALSGSVQSGYPDIALDAQGNLYANDTGNFAPSAVHVYHAPLSANSARAFSITPVVGLPFALTIDNRGTLFHAGGQGISGYTPPFSAASAPSQTALYNTNCCFSGSGVIGIATAP